MLRVFRTTVQKIQKCNYSVNAIPPPQKNPNVMCTGVFINNEWHKSKSGKTLPVINPTTGEKFADIQQGGKEDIDLAVDAAYEAFRLNSPWRTMDASERGRLLSKLADLVERDAVYLASLETLDIGQPYYNIAYPVNVQGTVKVLRYMAGQADKNHGKVIPLDGKFMCYTRHEPIGVCGQIIPWNCPLMMTATKIGPALTMGNTIVLKPSKQASLTALYIAQLAKEAGFPSGVLNVVPGSSDAGEALCANDKVDKITLAGSTEVGLKIQQASGVKHLKRTTLELGGKSPIIVLADSNIEQAVQQAHAGLFFNQGQICFAGSRTFIEDSIYDEFVERSVELAKKRIVGNPFDPKTEHGPLINEEQMKNVLRYIDTGVKEGAKLLVGGQRYGDKGYFVQPTVFGNVEDHHTIAKEEIFGPVQQLMRFKDLDEVIERANNTNYGLAAAVFSKDLDKVNQITQGIRAGIIWVNTYNVLGAHTPFGGFKDSGHGREMGPYSLDEYVEVKSIITAVPTKNS